MNGRLGRTMMDAVVAGPALLGFAVGLVGMSDSGFRGPRLDDYMIFVGMMAAVLLVWYRWRSTSIERTRALELGHDPGKKEGWTPLRVAAYVGLGVPLGTTGLAVLATATTSGSLDAPWFVAGMLGLASLVGTMVLVVRLPASAFTVGRGPDHDADAKPMTADPDAFDVVGRRG